MVEVNILYKNTVYFTRRPTQRGPISADWGQTMADVEWTQRDDFYWQGPPGWAICRVFVGGMWQYELWFSRGDNGTIYGMRASLPATGSISPETGLEGQQTNRSSRRDRDGDRPLGTVAELGFRNGFRVLGSKRRKKCVKSGYRIMGGRPNENRFGGVHRPEVA